MKTLAKKVLLLLVSTILTLMVIEGGLRLLGRKYTGSTYTADPVLGWALRPGAGAWETEEGLAWSKINSFGYRDRERTLEKPQSVYRVAVLGDSYTEARQVDMDKGFTALAEVDLNRSHCLGSSTVEVLNFGVPGYGTGQELIQLRERVWQFKPDMIVLQFHAGNDLYNNYRELNVSPPELAPYFVLKDGKLELDNSFNQGRAYSPTYIKQKGMAADITNRSTLLLLVYKWMRSRAQSSEQARLADPQAKSAVDPTAPPPEYQRFLSFLPPAIPSMMEAWNVTEALIGEFANEVREHRLPLLIMVVPTAHQLKDPEEREAYRAQFKIESLEYADDRIEKVASADGIPVLRLTTSLIEETQRTGNKMTGFPNSAQGHFNEYGHIVVARELVNSICQLGSAKELNSRK